SPGRLPPPKVKAAPGGMAAPVSPLLRCLNREGGVDLERNILARTGVCKEEAVRPRRVSPRGLNSLPSHCIRSVAEIRKQGRNAFKGRQGPPVAGRRGIE